MTNRVIKKNPYGKIKLDELERLEKKLGIDLPEQYRDYLIRYNGGYFEKDRIKISDAEGNTRIHHMYGLHYGPDYERLNIDHLIRSEYLAICEDAFGNHFFIKINGVDHGAIYFLDHEESDFNSALIKVTNSFSEFVDLMKSDEENMAEFQAQDPIGYAEFQKRAEELRRRREGGEK